MATVISTDVPSYNMGVNQWLIVSATGIIEGVLGLDGVDTVDLAGYAFLILEGPNGRGDHINISSSGVTNGIQLGGNSNYISNAGTVTTQSGSAIEFQNNGSFLADRINYINNVGSISSYSYPGGGAADYTIKVAGTPNFKLINSGSITSGDGLAISLDSGNDNINNTGKILGQIILGAGNDSLVNLGTIQGTVALNDGQDYFDSRSGVFVGSIIGWDGDKTIYLSDYGNFVTLSGGNNFVRGGSGADEVYSANGVDRLSGGGGDDTVQGSGGNDTVRGNEGDDNLNGGIENDVLYGQAGDDSLNGAAGNDAMLGGAGDDSYTVDSLGDIVNERAGGNDGWDTVTVAAGISFSLSDRTHVTGTVEDLNLFGSTGLENINGTGNAADNTIVGNGGANVLSGLAGDDAVSGGGGHDTLAGGSGADVLDGGAGSDRADYSGALAAVVVALDASLTGTGDAAGDTFVSIEHVTGSKFADVLRGNAAPNSIVGGLGADALTGNGGDDGFLYYATNEGGDTVNGFSNVAGNNDTFYFSHGAFGNHAIGALSAAEFQSGIGDAALAAGVRFFYETDTGILRFDSDGSGANAAVIVATLAGHPALTNADITFF